MTEQSAHFEDIVALGIKLVNELKLGDSVDTLGRWMVHYVAELIQEAECATDTDRSAKQILARDAILALWVHRYEMPAGTRPFEKIQPIFRALESLDPENKSSRYFSSSNTPHSEDGEAEETKKWIELAKGMDYVSRTLISHCLVCAGISAIDKSKEWVGFAEKAGFDSSFELPVIRFISDQRELMNKVDPNEDERRILKDRLGNLESFISAATTLVSDLKSRVDSLSPFSGDSNVVSGSK